MEHERVYGSLKEAYPELRRRAKGNEYGGINELHPFDDIEVSNFTEVGYISAQPTEAYEVENHPYARLGLPPERLPYRELRGIAEGFGADYDQMRWIFWRWIGARREHHVHMIQPPLRPGKVDESGTVFILFDEVGAEIVGKLPRPKGRGFP